MIPDKQNNNIHIYKSGQISVFVEANIKEAKHKSGINWRGLIIRGLKSLQKQPEENQNEKIGRMAQKIQELSLKIYNLEKKQNDTRTNKNAD